MKKLVILQFLFVFICILVWQPLLVLAKEESGNIYFCTADGKDGLTFNNSSSFEIVSRFNGKNAYFVDDSKENSLEFTFDSDFASGNTGYKNVEVTVQYEDTNYGSFFLAYDAWSNNNKKIKDYVELYNTSYGQDLPIIKTAVFRLEDARFSNRSGYCASDVRICVPISARAKGVYIYGISVEVLDTVSGVDVSVSTNSVGNIFFEGDSREFHVQYTNKYSTQIPLEITYTVINSDNDIVCYTENSNLTLNESASLTDEFNGNAISRYGVYKLRVEAENTEKNIKVIKEIPFSYSVNASHNGGNDKMGIGAHFNWGNRNPSEVIPALKKMGINNIRDGYGWNSFETSAGNYSEPATYTEYFNVAEDNDMGLMILSGYGNSVYGLDTYDLPKTDETREAYANYVYKLLELHSDDIEVLEIWNEPDITVFNSNNATVTDYARLVKAVYDRVHTDFPNIKLSGPVLSQSLTASGQSWFENLLKVDDDGDGIKDMSQYLGAISIHHYCQGHELSIEQAAAQIGIINELLETYGCGDKPKYHTEFDVHSMGNKLYSKYSTEDGVLINRGEYIRAGKLAQYFMTFIAKDLADRMYIYEFSDNGLAENAGLHGITKSVNYDVPFAAKPAFVAMANLNNLIGGMDSITYTKDSDAYIIEFNNTESKQKVYAMYTDEPYSSTEYNLNTNHKHTEFFDIYGNELDVEPVDGEYVLQLSEVPIYAKVYDEVENEINIYTDNGDVKIAGNLYTADAGDRLAIRIFDQNGNTEYIDQSKVDNNYAFSFTFKPESTNENYIVYLGTKSFGEVYQITFNSGKIVGAKLNMYTNMCEVSNMSEFTNASSLFVETKIYDSSISEFNVIVGYYKSGMLLDINNISSDAMTFNDGVYSYDMTNIANKTAEIVKVFVFDNLNNIKPLAVNVVIE